MKKANEIKRELQPLAPGLATMKKENPFRVPADYFVELPQEIRKYTIDQRRDNLLGRVMHLLWQFKYAVSMAMVSVLILIAVFTYRQQRMPVNKLSFDTISQEEINTFVANNINEFDEDLIFQTAMTDSDNGLFESLSDEELNQYLDEYLLNEVDEQTIEEILL